MISFEQSPSFIAVEESTRVSFDVFQSRMMNKFGAVFLIHDNTPDFVFEDLRVAGASTQPIVGGSYVYWPDKPRDVAETRATYGQPSISV